MDGNGVLSKSMKQGFISLALGLLSHLDNQILDKERIELVFRIGNI
jgi:hypothetical protein